MNMNNINIGKRLALGFSFILALTLIIGVLGIWRLQAVSNATQTMMHVPLEKERLISEWYSVLLAGVKRTTAVAKSTDPSLVNFFKDDVVAATKHSMDLQQRMEAMWTNDTERQMYKKSLEYNKEWLATRDRINQLKQNQQFEEANQVLENDFAAASKKFVETIQALQKFQRDELDKTTEDIKVISDQSRTLIITLSIIVLLLGILIARSLTLSITRPLQTAVSISRRIADGDLTADIPPASKDEAGQVLASLKHMQDNLLSIVQKIRLGTETIQTASVEISSGNLDLSSRTEQQASSLEETASAMEELTSTVKQNADNAKQANQLALSTSEIASEGGDLVQQVVTTMGAINTSSRKIVDIISVIDGIAFQTNILALNAAVEAARAGEQGRGFAVVATEVRSLAQRSASAAKEIKQLIDDSVSKVDTGSALVEKAGTTMTEIVSSIRRVTDIVGEITAASQEQSSGIEQVNLAITQMDEVTQQNAALVEEAAAATQSMQQQASDLAQSVQVFKLNHTSVARAMPVKAPAPVAKPVQASVARSTTPAALPATKVKKAAPVTAPSDDGDWETF